MLFRRKKNESDMLQERFEAGAKLVKDLEKKDFDKMMDGLRYIWQGYERIRVVQTREEKEMSDIEDAEKILEKEKDKK